MSRDAEYLEQILDAIIKIDSYISVGSDQFFAESLRQDAIIRQLEIIGEATKRISLQLRNANPEVPWQRMAGMRDVLIHNYANVDLTIVWGVAQQAMPELKTTIEAILGQEPS